MGKSNTNHILVPLVLEHTFKGKSVGAGGACNWLTASAGLRGRQHHYTVAQSMISCAFFYGNENNNSEVDLRRKDGHRRGCIVGFVGLSAWVLNVCGCGARRG